MRRIGVLSGSLKATRKRLCASWCSGRARKLGWSEGRDLVIDFRWGAGDPSLMRVHAKSSSARRRTSSWPSSTPAAAALRQETSAVPIVFLQVGNPVGSGFVASLAHPGGNLTGLTIFEPTDGRQVARVAQGDRAAREASPSLSSIPTPHSGQYWQTMEAAAPSLAVEFSEPRFAMLPGSRAPWQTWRVNPMAALVVMPDAFTSHISISIVALTARHRLPSIYPFRVFTVNGGLLSYGIDHVDVYRPRGIYVDRILKGEKPANLPVQAPTKFELIVNLKTARALGLDVPPFLLQRADEVIE